MQKKQRPHAVALRYDPGQDQAPRVVASGRGEVAASILAAAKEYGIPLHQDPQLTAVLIQQELGSQIPEDLYGVVAEILAFIYHLRQQSGTQT